MKPTKNPRHLFRCKQCGKRVGCGKPVTNSRLETVDYTDVVLCEKCSLRYPLPDCPFGSAKYCKGDCKPN